VFAFAAVMLGSSACASPSSEDMSAGVTTNVEGSSEDSTTTVSDTSDSETTTTDTTDTNDSADDNTDGSLSFYAGPDVDLGQISECDPFAQDCPEGEKCVPYASTGGNWDANKCVPVSGSGAAGDPCTYGGVVEATDDCDENTHCWNVVDVDGMLVGECVPFCAGTADDPVCPPGSACMIANEGSINLCIDQCDPLVQDCDEGLGCYWTNFDFLCVFETQNVPLGEPCGFWNDCLAGLYCADAAALPECAGSSCCTEYCEFGNPMAMCSTPGTECVAFFEQGMAPEGYENVGVCITP
jgi:hypothetical protein